MQTIQSMKVAFVHEFLTQYGGAERVLETFHELFPHAPVYTLVYDEKKTGGVFASYNITTSFVQKLPGSPKAYKWYLPFMPRAVESFDLSEFDVVVSDSSSFAKGVQTKAPTVHISYIHTPTRFLWQQEDEYIKTIPYPWWVKLFVKPLIALYIRPWDKKASTRPDVLVANSHTVKKRITKYYSREAQFVLYPPVDIDFFKKTSDTKEFFLTASRLEPYKRIDLVIKAFNVLKLPLVVAGEGSTMNYLRSIAGPTITFAGRVSDTRLCTLYSQARAFVFPSFEDAGIMTLESLACQTPVIGFAQGGTAEFVNDGIHGVLFKEQKVSDVVEAVKRFETIQFDENVLRMHAEQFSKEKFKEAFHQIIDHALMKRKR